MKISGPILDRIDLQVELKPLKASEIVENKESESSAIIQDHVINARKRQSERLLKYGIHLNTHMNIDLIKKYCVLDQQLQELMYTAVKKFKLSARSYYKILKVSRTIADLEKRESIQQEDILEALSFREVENILYNRSSEKRNIVL